jgi:hypothetical protein
MSKSLVINASQVSATGLATDQGRGRGGSTLPQMLMSFMGYPLQKFFTTGFSAVASLNKQNRRNERPPLRVCGFKLGQEPPLAPACNSSVRGNFAG